LQNPPPHVIGAVDSQSVDARNSAIDISVLRRKLDTEIGELGHPAAIRVRDPQIAHRVEGHIHPATGDALIGTPRIR
jgi:hypothetical protein